MAAEFHSRKIAVHLGSTTHHLHSYLQGIRDFANEHPGWELFGLDLPCYREIADPEQWAGAGCILAANAESTVARALIAGSEQVVSMGIGAASASRVEYDPLPGTLVALQHFATQGARHLVLFGEHPSEIERCIAAEAQKLGIRFDTVDTGGLRSLLQEKIEPIGVFATNCAASVQVRQIASDEGVEMPSELLLFSLNDNVNCKLSSPPISSIAYPAQEIGYRAAQLLEGQLAGGKSAGRTTIAQSMIEVRESSLRLGDTESVVALASLHVEKTIKSAPVRVDDLAKKFQVSRAHLTKLFQRHVGHSPSEFIRQKRLAAAMEMLQEPGQMVKAVAMTMGFSSTQEFARFFRRGAGVTPSDFAGNEPGAHQSNTD